jgi:hypothetical protein
LVTPEKLDYAEQEVAPLLRSKYGVNLGLAQDSRRPGEDGASHFAALRAGSKLDSRVVRHA